MLLLLVLLLLMLVPVLVLVLLLHPSRLSVLGGQKKLACTG